MSFETPDGRRVPAVTADEMRTCARRFWPYVVAALVGTLLGMGLLGLVPKPVLALGLYATGSVLALSVLAAAPGIAGVVAGSRVRSHVPPTYQTAGTLLLLTVIAARLTTAKLSGL